MSKQVRVVDFQICVGSTALGVDEERPVNLALFASYEPVRLWLKERSIKAPFRKLVVSFADERSSARWHGHVTNAIGICEVTEAVDLSTLRRHAGEHPWVLSIVLHALECVAHSTGWRSEELERFITAAAEMKLPMVHFFDMLMQEDRSSGLKCLPWLAIQPGLTRLSVRFVSRHGDERDVTVVEVPGPLYLEDSFPMVTSAIQDHNFVLLDKAGKGLARVPINESCFES